ncbi:MAG: hypothetical protein RMA76_24755 [Deltaproteobacteria bacterium]
MAAKEKKKPSYLKEMLLHPNNGYAAAAALVGGAVLSIPFGLGVGLIPVIAFGAGEAIASLFIPSSPKFREKVDKKFRSRGREEVRNHLIQEIQTRVGFESEDMWATYRRMRDRITSLQAMAAKHETQLSDRDVEALDDATVKWLGYWLANLTMADRRNMIDETTLQSRVADIARQIEKASSRSERVRLEKTRNDLEALIKRRTTLRTRQTEVETTMLTMADSLEEVYQQVVANPTAPEVGTQLREAAERMRVEEALDHAIEDELDAMLRPQPAKQTT